MRVGSISSHFRWPLIAAIVVISACAPRDYIREDYVGKRLLQPDRFPQQVKRDSYGNAIIETEPRRGLLSNLPSFSLPSIPFPSIGLPDIDLPDLWPFGDDEVEDSTQE